MSTIKNKNYWEKKLTKSKTDNPLVIAFAVIDTNPEIKTYKQAFELSKYFEALGWKCQFLSRLEGQWYKLNTNIDILITFSDRYNLTKIKTKNKQLFTMAFISNWHTQWLRLPYLDQYNLLGTPDIEFEKKIQTLPNNQLIKTPKKPNQELNYKLFTKELKHTLTSRLTKQTISLKIPARTWEGINNWGDYHFAVLLKQELEKLNYHVFLHVQNEWYSRSSLKCDVSLVLRGLRRHTINKNQLNIMWNISHPDSITLEEYNDYDHVFIASTYWAKTLSKKVSVKVAPLLQCTDASRFHPPTNKQKQKYTQQLLFVGNSRGIFREILKNLLPTKYDLAIYGEHPIKEIPKKYLRSDYLPNEQLYKHYGSASILLNDHWDDMKIKGFISNRIYDGLASGAFIISDSVEYMDDVQDHIICYKTTKELNQLIDYYLANPKERLKISKKGSEYVLKNHTFEQRAKNIHEIITTLLNTTTVNK